MCAHIIRAQVAVYRKTRNHSGSLTVSGYGWEPAERYKPIVGIAAGVMQSGIPLLTPDAHQEQDFVPGVDIPATGESQVNAQLMLPWTAAAALHRTLLKLNGSL